MKIGDYMGYELHRPTSGGKAGAGRNKTSTIQVRQGSCVVKQFRFWRTIFMDKDRAVLRAKKWIDTQIPAVAPTSALSQLIADTLTTRGYSPNGAENMAKEFLIFDSRRHCGKPDVNDPQDREAVEAFVAGVIFATKLQSSPA